MFRAVILFAAVGLSAANWELYKSVHGKSYGDEEDRNRQMIYEANVKKINEHNLRYDLGLVSFRMGLSQFTDLTAEEFKVYRGLKFDASNNIRSGRVFDHTKVRGDQPVAIDWRTMGLVTPVKDQGQCGSCWAFSTTGALEGQNFIKTGKLISLSEQNLVDCAVTNGLAGCNGGQMDLAFEYIHSNGGIDTEASYPYTAKQGKCQFNGNAVGAQCTGHVDVQASEDALKTAVITIGPISVAIDAGHDSFQHYKEGIYSEPACSSTVLDHGVLVVGYGTENGKDFWIVKNSWNTTWGDQGYIKMSRNANNQCGIATAASFPQVY